MENKITIYIDGKSIETTAGLNLLQVAKDNGFDIPSLCYHHKLTPTGACRLCLVKIEKMPSFQASCTVKVSDGMKVTAFDEELEKARRDILDLLLSEHNEEYDFSYDDEFRDLLIRYGLDKKRKYSNLTDELVFENDTSSYVLDYDASKCIKCFRCIKACAEVQGKNVLSFSKRGINTHVIGGFNDWENSECDGCGECVQLCPTGAIVEKPLLEKVDVRKIDKTLTTCTYCGVGCQIDLWTQDGTIVRATGREEKPNLGRLCVKGRFGYEFVHSPKRLTKPMIRKNGKLVEVSMNEALDFVASKLTEIKTKYGAESIGGYLSAKCTNEENYLFQKLFRAVLNNNNVEHCARLCHASTVTALQKAIGSGAMGNSVDELPGADCIIVIGNNPIETHPVTATFVKQAAANGCDIIVIDPRRTPLVDYATMWLKQYPGTDVAVVNGLLNVIINKHLIDTEFINERIEGGMVTYETIKQAVQKYTPEEVEKISGIPAEDLIKAALIYGEAERASVLTGMGMSQSEHGTDNVLALINMALITGNFGRESTGINPPRGQNNVQGASDMGGINNVYPGYQSVADKAIRKKFSKAWNVPVEKLNPNPGLTAVEMMQAAYKDKIKAMYVMGENPLLSDPNLNHTLQAIQKLDLLIVQDIFMTETAKFADVILPAASFAEKEGTFSNTDRHILRVRKAVESPGEAKEDWWYISEISKRLGYEMNYNSASDIMDEIASVTPSYGGISYKRLETEKLQWPCPTADHPGTRFMHKDSFPIGKARLHAVNHQEMSEAPDKQYPFILNTGRNLYHYHTATMSRKSTPLNSFSPGPYLEICQEDLKMIGFADGDKAKLISRRGEICVWLKESNLVSKGELFLPFHFHESSANILTDDKLDPQSRIPRYKQTACRLEKTYLESDC